MLHLLKYRFAASINNFFHNLKQLKGAICLINLQIRQKYSIMVFKINSSYRVLKKTVFQIILINYFFDFHYLNFLTNMTTFSDINLLSLDI